MKTCISCGNDYPYDCNKPLGSSADRCSRCRKHQTILNKKIVLLDIASNDNPKCYKCGYHNPTGLILIDGIKPLFKPKNEIQQSVQAKKQFILCLNCNSELEHNLIEVNVVDSKSYPIKVEMYEVNVQVVKKQIQPTIIYNDEHSIETEVVFSGGESAQAVNTKKRLGRTLETMP